MGEGEPVVISVEEARERILSSFSVLPAGRRPLLEALGQVLAEDIVSDIDVPPRDNSAMDGYAVRADDTRGASESSPVSLKVIGEVAAGYESDREVTPGTAIRIMTGAPVPAGADAVVQFEDTDEGRPPRLVHRMGVESGGRPSAREGKARVAEGGEVKVYKLAPVGLNIREAGEDLKRGQLVFTKGTVIRPSEAGVLASLGYAQVPVYRRPRVAILSTGDELVDINEPLPPGKIRNSNSYSVAALVLRYGGIPVLLGIARDVVEQLTAKLEQAQSADMLITSGGVSMGDYDVVKDVLAAKGEVGFWQVRMKPGKPLAFGRIGKVPLIGLPGNPVSSMVTFEQFARPAILKMLGKVGWEKPTVEAILDDVAKNNDGRRCYYRAWVTRENGPEYVGGPTHRPEFHARLTGSQGSGILTSMAQANGLVIIPEDVREVRPGQWVKVQMLDWPEGMGV